MKIFETIFDTVWVYSTDDEDFDAVSFAEYLKEHKWDNSSIATEMADRFIYMSLLGKAINHPPKLSSYDFNDASIEWDDNIFNIIRAAFSNFVWQLFVDDEDDYDHKVVDYQEEIDGLTISFLIDESGGVTFEHSITFSIETNNR